MSMCEQRPPYTEGDRVGAVFFHEEAGTCLAPGTVTYVGARARGGYTVEVAFDRTGRVEYYHVPQTGRCDRLASLDEFPRLAAFVTAHLAPETGR